MRVHYTTGVSSAILLTLSFTPLARAQSDEPATAHVLEAGRPLQVALEERVRVKRVGQSVTGTLLEPVYAYDCIVVPAGTKVVGHVANLEGPSKLSRIRTMLGGDFTPARRVVLQFDTLILDDHPLPVHTIVTSGIPHLRRSVALTSGTSTRRGVLGRAEEEAKTRTNAAVADVKQHARDTLSAITQPGKMERLKEAVIARLPYHPQFLGKGTAYHAELTTPLDFGVRSPVVLAPVGALPAPESVLTARLATPLDSSKTPRGTPIEAIVTEPVFSSDRQLILPEGTTLTGEVTRAKQPGWFHRNGQLRFLFERVQPPHQEASRLLASLYSVQASDDDHVAVDEEGGATLTNPRTRFITPALALLALRASVGGHHRFDNDDDDVPGATVQSGNAGSAGLGGFFGLGVMGVGLSQISHPVGVALAVVGAVRTVYTNILGKGQDVSFPADTSIELQLAPGPAPEP